MRPVVVIGGGLSGVAAAWRLAEAGVRVTLVERAPTLGGLAASFTREGRHYPLGYHHIGAHDTTLHATLRELGLWTRVRWRRLPMAFLLDRRLHTLADLRGALRFPLTWRQKARMARLALVRHVDGPPDPGESAEQWLRARIGDELVREVFEPLTRIKFGAAPAELSAAWLHARLAAREAEGRFGVIEGADWTKLLCDALQAALLGLGVDLLLGVGARRLVGDTRVEAVELDDGRVLEPHRVLLTIPPPLQLRLSPDSRDPELAGVRYTGVVSVVMAVDAAVPVPFYWTNVVRPLRSYGGIFRLDVLNPGLGPPGQAILNLATHTVDRGPGSLLQADPAAIVAGHLAELADDLGVTLTPRWAEVSRIPWYSPVFSVGFRNLPPRSPQWSNVWRAGNYRTWPAVTSTGAALRSGYETAAAMLREER